MVFSAATIVVRWCRRSGTVADEEEGRPTADANVENGKSCCGCWNANDGVGRDALLLLPALVLLLPIVLAKEGIPPDRYHGFNRGAGTSLKLPWADDKNAAAEVAVVLVMGSPNAPRPIAAPNRLPADVEAYAAGAREPTAAGGDDEGIAAPVDRPKVGPHTDDDDVSETTGVGAGRDGDSAAATCTCCEACAMKGANGFTASSSCSSCCCSGMAASTAADTASTGGDIAWLDRSLLSGGGSSGPNDDACGCGAEAMP